MLRSPRTCFQRHVASMEQNIFAHSAHRIGACNAPDSTIASSIFTFSGVDKPAEQRQVNGGDDTGLTVHVCPKVEGEFGVEEGWATDPFRQGPLSKVENAVVPHSCSLLIVTHANAPTIPESTTVTYTAGSYSFATIGGTKDRVPPLCLMAPGPCHCNPTLLTGLLI